MPESIIFLDYTGIIDQEKIDILLKKLKKSEEFLSIDKTTGKRLYSVLVECLDNIVRYSVKNPAENLAYQPFISVRKQDNKLIISTGNQIMEGKTAGISDRLKEVNEMDENALTVFYEKIINKESIPENKGAGLGFILIKLKSGNRISYSTKRIDKNISFLELEIIVNKYIMRKLVIEKTASSPKVILDPEKNIFEISGESRPPDVTTFYGQILSWMDDYSSYLLKLQGSNEPPVFIFDLEYFNSSSAKYILDFCKQIASLRTQGRRIDVKWKYEEDDDDILEAGREMSRIAKLPFEFVIKQTG